MVRTLMLISLMIVLGCSSEEKKDDSGGAVASGKKLGALAISKGLDQAGAALAEGKKHAAGALESGKSLGLDGWAKGRAWSQISVAEVQAYGEKLASTDTKTATLTINGLLEKVAKDPTKEEDTAAKVTRMMVLMMPLVGPTKRFADARALFENGKKEGNERKINEARREALLACAEAGLDIGTLGLVGSRVDVIATGADKALTLLKATRAINVLASEDMKGLDGLLDKLLEIEDVRAAADTVLELGQDGN
jgi:hypothetical protein